MTTVREVVTLIRYQVDNSSLKQDIQAVQSWLGQVAAHGRTAASSWRASARESLKDHVAAVDSVMRTIWAQRQLNQEQRRSVQNVKDIQGRFNSLAGAVRGVVREFVGFDTLKSFVMAGDQFGRTQARLKGATGSQEEFAAVDQELSASSRQSHQPFEASVDLFVRTDQAMKALGKSTRDTLDVVSATNLSLAASGADASQAAQFIEQFAQDMNKGALSGQGFQSMLSTNQRMLSYLLAGLNQTSPALGATRENFQQLVNEGKITTEAMIPALRSQLSGMSKDVQAMPKSLQGAMTDFQDQVGRTSWEMLKQHGVIKFLTTVLRFLGDNLREILDLLLLMGASWAMNRLVGSAVSLGAVLRGLSGLTSVLARQFWVMLAPFLRWMIVLEAISLIFSDVQAWLSGGDSLLGSIIGQSSEWEGKIQAVRDALEWVRNLFGFSSEQLDQWLSKFSMIGTVVLGLVMVIGWIPTLIVAVVALLFAHWGKITEVVTGLWDSFTNAADQAWQAIQAVFKNLFDWFEQQFAKVGDFFTGMVKKIPGVDTLMSTFGFSTPAPGVSAEASYTDGRMTTINIHTKDSDPGRIALAAQHGVQQGYGSAAPFASGMGMPNVEAAP
ncbi:tape measure protein [Alcaligenes sp. SDU_A2]|uniref:tape measure protein n=1 Tax=Alcaligenes sp. SDU_A2 TaxID=3136634 RepID=UPI00311E9E42